MFLNYLRLGFTIRFINGGVYMYVCVYVCMYVRMYVYLLSDRKCLDVCSMRSIILHFT